MINFKCCVPDVKLNGGCVQQKQGRKVIELLTFPKNRRKLLSQCFNDKGWKGTIVNQVVRVLLWIGLKGYCCESGWKSTVVHRVERVLWIGRNSLKIEVYFKIIYTVGLLEFKVISCEQVSRIYPNFWKYLILRFLNFKGSISMSIV